jgi:hypothetical protein
VAEELVEADHAVCLWTWSVVGLKKVVGAVGGGQRCLIGFKKQKLY